jgi:hypothetical protein
VEPYEELGFPEDYVKPSMALYADPEATVINNSLTTSSFPVKGAAGKAIQLRHTSSF